MAIERARSHCLAVIILSLASFICLPIVADGPGANSITVVYNHIRNDSATELELGGGFGAFVEFNGKAILFDTGGQADILLNNIQKLKHDASRIEAVVISHNHWDHVYGLPGVLSVTRDDPVIYAPESSRDVILQQNPRANIITVDGPTEIMPKVWLTGSMKIEYRETELTEQALVLEGEDGLIVLVGCSHPGIVAIIERVRGMFETKGVVLVGGGFHLRSTPRDKIRQIAAKLRQYGVEQIAPSHCTGEDATAVFRQEWGNKLVAFDLGDSFKF